MIVSELMCGSISSKKDELDKLWKDNYLERIKSYTIPSEDQKWGQLILVWNEKRGQQIISHTYAPWLDMEEWSGIYVDDRPLKIYIKCLLQCLCRPLHLVVKTIYHLSMIQVFYEIFKTYLKRQSMKECLIHSMQSVADIIRTPLFDTINIISSIAILILSPYHPQLILSGRRFLGKIENISNWGNRKFPWTLASCFQPAEFSFLYVCEKEDHEDTLYQSDDLLERQLTNFARRAIHYKQTHIDMTTCQKSGLDVPYTSEMDFIP